jgi:septal ring-binding cell division protein DamX
MQRSFLFFAAPFVLAASTMAAQAAPIPRTAAVSVYARARQLVVSGNGAAGRVLVDSMVAASAPDTPAYADALYWRATLAATSADAESDYRRVVVEYPLSAHAGDALLQLAQLEIARNDRKPAITHLQRFLIENPSSPERHRAGFQLVRLAFEQNDPQVGCTFLGRVLREVPDSLVEMRNQLTYYSPRCSGVDTANFNQVVTNKVDSTAKPDATRRDSATAAKAKFTLQIAAYKTRAEADALVKRLKDRGLEVRIAGTTKTFRVRVGRYATRAAAASAARQLKATKKIDAFVTEIGADDK